MAKRITIEVDERFHKKIKKEALERGITIKTIVMEAIISLLIKKEPTENNN